MYRCMRLYVYGFMYLRLYVSMDISVYIFSICMYICGHENIFVAYICAVVIYVVVVCMPVCIYSYVFIYVCMYVFFVVYNMHLICISMLVFMYVYLRREGKCFPCL